MRKVNKYASFQYQLLDRFEAGIVLSGAEAKCVRGGRVDISRAHAKFLKNELYLVNANIPVTNVNYQPTRSRKLLLHKSELRMLEGKLTQKKLTIVPVSIYTNRYLIKVELALASSKREYQKRDQIKRRDIQRDIDRELR